MTLVSFLLIALIVLSFAALRMAKVSFWNPINIYVLFCLVFSVPRILTLYSADFQSEYLEGVDSYHLFEALALYLIAMLAFGIVLSFTWIGLCGFSVGSNKHLGAAGVAQYTISPVYTTLTFIPFAAFGAIATLTFISGAQYADSAYYVKTRESSLSIKILSGFALCFLVCFLANARSSLRSFLTFAILLGFYGAATLIIFRAAQVVWSVLALIFIQYSFLGYREVGDSAKGATLAAAIDGLNIRYKILLAVIGLMVFIFYKASRTFFSYGFLSQDFTIMKSINFQTLWYFFVYKGSEFSILDTGLRMLSVSQNFLVVEKLFESLYGAFFMLIPDAVYQYEYEPLGKIIKREISSTGYGGGTPIFGFVSVFVSGSTLFWLAVTLTTSLLTCLSYLAVDIKSKLSIFYPYFLFSFINFLRLGDFSVAYTQTIFQVLIPCFFIYIFARKNTYSLKNRGQLPGMAT